MLLYTDSRKLVPLFIVVAYRLTNLKAMQEPKLSKEIVQLDQLGRFPRDETVGADMASTGTEAGSQSHNVAPLEAQNLRQAVGSTWRKLKALVFGTTTRLPDERKVQIHKQLEANREKIMAMKSEYESLLQSIKELDQKMTQQVRRRCKVTGSVYVSGVLRKLETYHKKNTLILIQNRLYELGKIGKRMSIIESVSPSWAWIYSWKNKLGGVLPFVLSCLGGVKQIMIDVEVIKNLLSTRAIGKRLENAELLGANLGGISHSTHFEYKKLVMQNLNHLTSVTRKKTNHSPTPPSILSGDHLEIVMEKVQIERVRDLSKILNSITFQTRENFPPCEWLFEDMLHHIKLGYEKCAGFQVLAFLHKFEFIAEREVNSFFESKETLELTARHLFDLFHETGSFTSTYHSLVPDMNFIINDWHTRHLRYLKDLNEEKQAYLVYEVLRLISENLLKKLMGVTKLTPEAANIFSFFSKNTLLQDIKDWSPQSWNSITKHPQDDILRQNLESIVKVFNKFPISTEGPHPFKDLRRLIEFLINYYILKFMKTYGNDNVKRFIEDYSNDDRNSSFLIEIYGQENGKAQMNTNSAFNNFKMQSDLITYGLETQQLINKSNDYEYFLSYPKSLIHMIPKWVTPKAHQELREKVHQAEKRYLYSYNLIHKLSKTNEDLNKWLENEVVDFFLRTLSEVITMERPSSHYNLWLIYSKDHQETNPKSKSDCEELAAHLSQYYNVLDDHNQWSPEANDKLKSGLMLDLAEKSQKKLE